MAAGDLYIRRNGGDATAITIANLDSSWDTLVKDVGGIVSYTNPNLRLNTGLYLIQYSEVFYTPTEVVDNTNRIEIQGEVHTAAGVQGGYSQDYIRQTSGQYEVALTGSMILNITSDNTDVFIRFFRTDDSTEVVTRKPNNGSVSILQLDTSHGYGLYSTSASEATAGTTVRNLTLNTNDRQDTGFSRSGNTVTLANSGRYLVTYAMDIFQTGTGRESVYAYLRRNGATEVAGSKSFSYLRGVDGCIDGALTWIGLVDVSANDTFDITWACPSSATITSKAGAKLQFWRLPSTAKTAIIEATTGNFNTNAPFAWDSASYIDVDAFGYTASDSKIVNKSTTHLLSFATFSKVTDTAARGYPEIRFSIDGAVSNLATGGVYERNSGTSNTAVNVSTLLTDIDINSEIEVVTEATGVTTAMTNTKGQFALLSLESIWNYTYTLPPKLNVVPIEVYTGSTAVLVTGNGFGNTQGTGKLELSDTSDYTGTKVLQTINLWNDTSIDFDLNDTGLLDGKIWFYVTNDAGLLSSGALSNLNEIDYVDFIKSTGADLLHTFDNTYADAIGVLDATQTPVGSFSFKTTPITRGSTYSWSVDDNASRTEVPDSSFTNLNPRTERTVCGWIMLDRVHQTPSGIYEEGGGINNMYFVVGFGNIILGNIADSNGAPDYKIQGFSDFKLSTLRPYFLTMRLKCSTSTGADDGYWKMHVDSKEVSKYAGLEVVPNLIKDTSFSQHSGDWSYGKPDGSLDTGGTDIAYPGATNTLLANWFSYSDLGAGVQSEDTVRELFLRGVIPTTTVTSSIASSMSTVIGNLENTNYIDKPLAIKVYRPTDSSSLRADLTNVIFDDRCSYQILWIGEGTLTLDVWGNTNVDLTKCYSSNGGNIIINTPNKITVTGVPGGSKVVIFEAGTNNIIKLSDPTTGPVTVETDVNSVDVFIAASGYKLYQDYNVSINSGTIYPVIFEADYVYKNL